VEGKEGRVVFDDPLLLLEVSAHVLRKEKRHLMRQAIVIPQVRPDSFGDEAIDCSRSQYSGVGALGGY
jgi:hypothetical protein